MEKLPVDNDNHNEPNTNADNWSETEKVNKADNADDIANVTTEDQPVKIADFKTGENKHEQPSEKKAPEYKPSAYSNLNNANVEKKGHRGLIMVGVGGAAVAALAVALFTGNANATKSTDAQPIETTETQPQPDMGADSTDSDSDTSVETAEAPEQESTGGINFDDYPYDDNLPLPEEYQDDDIEISPEQYAKNIALSIDDITEDLNINKLSDVDKTFLKSYLVEQLTDNGYSTSVTYERSSDNKIVIPGVDNGYNIMVTVNNDNEFAIFVSTSSSQDGYLYRSQYIPTPDQLALIYAQNASNLNATDQEVCEY